MKKITIFYLENCPYCRHAIKAMKELSEENPSHPDLNIEWIEESRHPQIAKQYDYYFVPTVFVDGEKSYEANPYDDYAAIKEGLRISLNSAF